MYINIHSQHESSQTNENLLMLAFLDIVGVSTFKMLLIMSASKQYGYISNSIGLKLYYMQYKQSVHADFFFFCKNIIYGILNLLECTV